MHKTAWVGVFASIGMALIALAPVSAAARDRITVYQHADYMGDSRVITDDEPNLADLDFNDVISSIRVDSGTWQVCEHANYRGRCRTIDGNDRNLASSGFNDIISSIRRVRDDNRYGDDNRDSRDDNRYGDDNRDRDRYSDNRDDGRWSRDPSWDRDSRWDPGWDRWVDHSRWRDSRDRPDITLYEDDNFNGDRRRIDGDVVDLRNLGFNDRASSLRIRRGVWQVCVDSWYRNYCRTFGSDVRSLRDYGMNDKISSVRRVR